MSNYFISPNASAYKETEHPTEKPVKLLKHLVEVNSNKGDVVLDCFMGSGTTAVACKELNRNFIGIEIEKKYFDIVKRRIDQTITSMF
jgi:DNA modification methylase